MPENPVDPPVRCEGVSQRAGPQSTLFEGENMRVLLIASLCTAFLIGCRQESSPTTQPAATNEPERVLRHVVLFKFKDDATAEQIDKVVEAFRALPEKISEIHAFEWGTDVSPEGLSQGLTHAFVLTFRTEADRDAYLPHPAHKEFGQTLGPILDKVTVVDYWAQ